MRKRNRYPLHEKVQIVDVAAEGKAIGKIDELVIFVTNVIPGDIVDVQIIAKKKNYQEGVPVFFHKLSEQRVEPVCEHFGVCGGCKWQQLPYDRQLHYKQKQVVDNLTRIGKIDVAGLNPILGSEKTEYYRNKLEYTFSNLRWLAKEEMDIPNDEKDLTALGFHIPKMFDKILDINHCYLQPSPSNEIRLALKKYAREQELTFYNQRSNEGFLRNVIIRTSSTGQLMVILIVAKNDKTVINNILGHLADLFPQITSLMYVVNYKLNDSITDLNVKLWRGQDFIEEKMDGLTFKIGPKSFYQTNSEQAYTLYSKTAEFAGLKGHEVVYDLYTGTGTIANFVARKAAKVVGVEYVPEAIADAHVNSEINGITNTSFFAGDLKDVLNQQFIDTHGKPHVIITDPPRAGMHKDVITTMLKAAPEKIVYVSCNPATQARDIALMAEQYEVTAIQPVDMFPHTHHVENIVLLVKKQ